MHRPRAPYTCFMSIINSETGSCPSHEACEPMTFVTGSDHSVGFPLMMRTRAPLFVLDPRLRARCASHTAPRLPNRIPLRAPGWPRMTVAVLAVKIGRASGRERVCQYG